MLLLLADDCMWLRHSLQACLGAFHGTMPGFGSVPGAHWQEAWPERCGHRQGGPLCYCVHLPVDTLICISGCSAAPGGPERQHKG